MADEKKLSGKASIYRRKQRLPKSILLTKPGLVLLAQELARTQMSLSDYFEGLLRKERRRAQLAKGRTAAQIAELAAPLKPGEFVAIPGIEEKDTP